MEVEEQKKKRKKTLKIVGALIGLVLLIGCSAIAGAVFLSGAPTATPTPVAVATSEVTRTIATATSQPTASPTTELCVCDPCPTCEVCPTEVPAPTPAPVTEPVVFEGSGEAVTDNLRLSTCQKSVFSWQHGGTSNFFVDICGASCQSLIIAGRDDTTGEVLQPLEVKSGGYYYLVVESVEGPWTVTWECRD